jgi:hypothetical protein
MTVPGTEPGRIDDARFTCAILNAGGPGVYLPCWPKKSLSSSRVLLAIGIPVHARL